MLNIHKYYVLDENQQPFAVQIPIEEFERIEEMLENFGLAELMEETKGDEQFTGESARQYYESLKCGKSDTQNAS